MDIEIHKVEHSKFKLLTKSHFLLKKMSTEVSVLIQQMYKAPTKSIFVHMFLPQKKEDD